jgi:Tol biopolymer transport system component
MGGWTVPNGSAEKVRRTWWIVAVAAWAASCDPTTAPPSTPASTPPPVPPSVPPSTPPPAAPPAGLSGQLAFVSGRDGNPEIYTVNADGHRLKRLTTNPGPDLDPAWSPDGSRIAFVSDRKTGPGIYVMAADGSNVTRRTSGAWDETPAWSPDGSTLVFSTLQEGWSRIAVLRNTDGAAELLTAEPGVYIQPSWSPNGQLAFVSDREFFDFVFNIYTMRADGSDQTLRIGGVSSWPHISRYLHPAWSPDGTMIAYVYGRVVNSSDIRFTVAVASAEGVFLKDLAWAGDITWMELHDPGSLAWSPDGRGVAYTFVDCDLVSKRGCSRERSVAYVSLDRSQHGRIVASAHNPSWRP